MCHFNLIKFPYYFSFYLVKGTERRECIREARGLNDRDALALLDSLDNVLWAMSGHPRLALHNARLNEVEALLERHVLPPLVVHEAQSKEGAIALCRIPHLLERAIAIHTIHTRAAPLLLIILFLLIILINTLDNIP